MSQEHQDDGHRVDTRADPKESALKNEWNQALCPLHVILIGLTKEPTECCLLYRYAIEQSDEQPCRNGQEARPIGHHEPKARDHQEYPGVRRVADTPVWAMTHQLLGLF